MPGEAAELVDEDGGCEYGEHEEKYHAEGLHSGVFAKYLASIVFVGGFGPEVASVAEIDGKA